MAKTTTVQDPELEKVLITKEQILKYLDTYGVTCLATFHSQVSRAVVSEWLEEVVLVKGSKWTAYYREFIKDKFKNK